MKEGASLWANRSYSALTYIKVHAAGFVRDSEEGSMSLLDGWNDEKSSNLTGRTWPG